MKSSSHPPAFDELDLFTQMAERVPAYRSFLRKHKFDPHIVRHTSDLAKLPIMDKKNYIDQHTLPELCWDGVLEQNGYIVNSSGSTGVPYFWPRNPNADHASAQLYEQVLKSVLCIKGSTLLINSFGQGSWIAATEAFLASQKVRGRKLQLVTINTGIEIHLIVQQLRALGSYFDSILFVGYPPFIKDLFEVLRQQRGILSPHHAISVIVGGESISEAWRQHTSSLLTTDHPAKITSIYGMSDGGGILAFETSLTIAVRTYIHDMQNASSLLGKLFGGTANTALFQYDPTLRYFENGPTGQLLVHNKHGIPLFRYDTKDRGGVVAFGEVQPQLVGAGLDLLQSTRFLPHPFVYLLGRTDYAITFYSLNIYPEHLRTVIDELADPVLTGRFVMERCETPTFDEQFVVNLELVNKTFSPKVLRAKEKALQDYIFEALPRLNSEYAKVISSVGIRAKPSVKLCPYGSIGYITGKKHTWVKKD